MQTQPLFLLVDLFCGAGGTTTGFAQAAMAVKYFPADLRNQLLSDFIKNDSRKETISKEQFEKDFQEAVFKIVKVIACVNHDHKAILSHWANNPEVKHFEEDIRNLDLTELVNIVSTSNVIARGWPELQQNARK